MTYTALALLAVPLTLVLDVLLLRTRVVTRRTFWVSYAIVLCFQLLTNGVLTGADIVRYDPAVILGLRVVWAPVEDLLFGFALVTQAVAWWVFWGRVGVQREPPAGPPRWRDRSRPRARPPASSS